jgi:heme a synthase
MPRKISRAVSIWLTIGCIMVLFQIIIGGITRLTDSGLSITEWEVVKGTLPPLNETEWQLSFEKYKTFAKKQYESLHSDMTIEKFKQIYFWEYFHRLWARLMGFVFVIPFVIFLIRKKIDSTLIKRLLIVILLASLSAIFGWLMVASGLSDDKRTWVNAYNLLIHLILASSLFSYLFWTYYHYSFPSKYQRIELKEYKLLYTIGIILFLQIAFGALMAGMKAALVFPYPFIIPKWQVLKTIFVSSPALHFADWIDYEPNPTIKLIVQIIHRCTAFILGFLSIWFFYINKSKMFIAPSFLIFYILLIIQIALGILTVMFSLGKVPVVLGVVHQLTAFLLLASYLWIVFASKKRK